MKISELIDRLQATKDDLGDIDVMVNGFECGYNDVVLTEIKVVSKDVKGHGRNREIDGDASTTLIDKAVLAVVIS